MNSNSTELPSDTADETGLAVTPALTGYIHICRAREREGGREGEREREEKT